MSEHSYNRMAAYRETKLANILFAFELNRRLEAKGTSTKSIAVQPGLAKRSWADNNLDGFRKFLGKIMSLTSYHSASMVALPLLYAAVDSKAKSGGYYGLEHDTKGYPVEAQAGEGAYNVSDAKGLSELNEKLTSVKYEALT